MTPQNSRISVCLFLAIIFSGNAFAAKADKITFKPISSTYVAGGAGKVVLGAVAASRASIHYTSSDPSVLLIDDSTGRGTIRKPGSVDVTASTVNTPAGYTSAQSVKVRVTIAKAAAPLMNIAPYITKAVYVPGSTVTIGNPLPSDYGGTISYTPTGPASVNNGLVTFNGIGSVSVALSPSASPNYLTPKTVSVNFKVADRGTPTVGSVSFPDNVFEPSAKVTIPTPPIYPSQASGGTWTYTTTSKNASISGSTITLTGAGPVAVTAVYNGNEKFGRSTPTPIGTLNVAKGKDSIIKQPIPSVAPGASLLLPNLKSFRNQPVVYSLQSGSGASVAAGKVTPSNARAGNVTVKGTTVPSANYNAADPITYTVNWTYDSKAKKYDFSAL